MLKSNIYFSRITNLSSVGKFIAIAVLCGGASSFARFFISDIVQKKVRWEDPVHMSWLPSTYLGIPAFLAGALLTFVLVKVIIGEGYLNRNIFIWIFIGLLYGIFVPFMTGLLLPMGMFVMNVSISGLICGMCLAVALGLMDRIQLIGSRWQLAVGIAFSAFMIIFSKFAPTPFLANFG